MMKQDTYTSKMLRKIEAHKRGKRVKVTYPNPNASDKKTPFITVDGKTFFGSSKD